MTKSRRRCCGELRGMFAFALWDGARRRMLLARDPYGIKPLYYADDGGTIRFASQVRALVAGGKVSTAVRSRRRRRILSPRHGAGAVHDVPRHSRASGGLVCCTSMRTASREPVHVLFDRRDAARCGRTRRALHRRAAPRNRARRGARIGPLSHGRRRSGRRVSRPPASTRPPSSRSRARPARRTCRR